MKTWIFALLGALLVVGGASAQTKPTAKAAEPAKPTTVVPAPEPVKPADTPRVTNGTPGVAKAGLTGILGKWNATDDTAAIGVEYYLDTRLVVQAAVALNLTGWTGTSKDLVANTTTTTNQNSPEFGVELTAIEENRISPQATWGWGGQLGLLMASKNYSDATTKKDGFRFDMTLGGVLNVKYQVLPGISFYLQPALVLTWEPVNGITDPSGSSLNGVKTVSGTKQTDDFYSTLGISAKTSALGVVFYLN